jgi:GC-rich sequence DNA-binding factor
LGTKKPKDLLIPDQATIEAIRVKRERLKKSRAAALDYISMDEGSNHNEAEGLSNEELEFQGRITMFGEKKKTESTDTKKTKKGVFEDDDGDERATSVHFVRDSENGESAMKKRREREQQRREWET